jgi:hypothetical protein
MVKFFGACGQRLKASSKAKAAESSASSPSDGAESHTLRAEVHRALAATNTVEAKGKAGCNTGLSLRRRLNEC